MSSMGISMGGAVVTMSSNLDFPDSVCGIIDDCGFTTSTKMLELNCKSHLPKATFITYREPQIERFPRFSGLSVEVSVTSGHFFFMKSLKGINCSMPAGSSL